MTGVVIVRLIGLADGAFPTVVDGQYIKAFDPTWVEPKASDMRNGTALLVKKLETTRDRDEAMRFMDVATALAFYRSVSPNRPRRPDGEPNRPLTAFTVEIEKC